MSHDLSCRLCGSAAEPRPDGRVSCTNVRCIKHIDGRHTLPATAYDCADDHDRKAVDAALDQLATDIGRKIARSFGKEE